MNEQIYNVEIYMQDGSNPVTIDAAEMPLPREGEKLQIGEESEEIEVLDVVHVYHPEEDSITVKVMTNGEIPE